MTEPQPDPLKDAFNAKLAAAAPELLECLVDLVCQVRPYAACVARQELEEADALIARLCGEEA